jgi:hypothetical protein
LRLIMIWSETSYVKSVNIRRKTKTTFFLTHRLPSKFLLGTNFILRLTSDPHPTMVKKWRTLTYELCETPVALTNLMFLSCPSHITLFHSTNIQPSINDTVLLPTGAFLSVLRSILKWPTSNPHGSQFVKSGKKKDSIRPGILKGVIKLKLWSWVAA